MLSSRAGIAIALAALMVAAPAFATLTHKSTTGTHSRSGHKLSGKTRGKHKLHGQQVIDSARATQIQQALIREHYLNGSASGEWDATTQAAMQKYQSDHGWQTRLLPDSRALKSLGLGPDYSGALNAKDSSFAAPAPASAIPAGQAAGFAAASGVATPVASAGVNH
ncbi:MAG TPA: peptidoglycan-binding domain-containing protein [Gemmataceae bacterium]|nr:peptidoglycan-binding domain-containing protein [Gemmataceae bacterium]